MSRGGGQVEDMRQRLRAWGTAVLSSDPIGLGEGVESSYSYADPAWHYNYDPFVPSDERTWSQWRGYGKVTTTTGAAGSTQPKTVSLDMQGMDGDKQSDGTTASATRTGLDVSGLDVADLTDSDQDAGFLREQVAYDGYQRLTDAWTPSTASCATSCRTTANLGGASPCWTSYAYTSSELRRTETTHASGGDSTRTYCYSTATPHRLTATTASCDGVAATYTYDNTGDTALLTALHRGPGQVLEASKVSIVQRAAPLRSILASLVISGTPRLSARASVRKSVASVLVRRAAEAEQAVDGPSGRALVGCRLSPGWKQGVGLGNDPRAWHRSDPLFGVETASGGLAGVVVAGGSGRAGSRSAGSWSTCTASV
jgi:hypothetical protein